MSLLFFQTVHSGLKITVKKRSGAGADGSALKSAALIDLQQQFEGVEYILVDEGPRSGRIFLDS